MVRLGEAHPSIWEPITERLEIILAKYEFQADDLDFGWKKMANKRMADRNLDEKYGIFKEIALHPRWISLMEFVEKYGNINLNPVLGDSLMPLTAAIILLFMLHRRISNSILILVAAFIFNLNPIYVIAAIFVWKISYKRSAPKNYIKLKSDFGGTTKIPSLTRESAVFDHVLIGGDISTFYAAALLAKVGHKCCVIQPKGLSSNEVSVSHI